ncbi:DUF4359 domain-containing protein [Clostridium botulinum]|uniref:DUF4359 domain-containing protein n=1 Tax=Clostridium botulinum TaxID=1491 RepID=A0A6G4D3T1_CLOBO|nr:DUF4359 domain-containing protein [Clostridium botulinum]AJD26372.1 hypothetical protein T257_3175 [Clostridium botulinum CDC_297]MBY6876983.1 DUF4359 domain-containing protein [Clostridium botulinum]MBY6893224.1 DUF4359 domain-containing protein [Clostridium botulinum]MBY6894509.1 DUF4359 domain-containing protein [Clostridium botulinum]MBY6901599.1 DUF4359 domain-containing protein [Clostridium botulinum]
MSKNKKIFIVSILSILILSCVFTNPSKNEYVNWSKEQMQSQSSNILEKGLVGFLGDKIISNTTTTKNYIIFSIYKTEMENEKLTTLGILKNFIPINKEKVENKVINKGAN